MLEVLLSEVKNNTAFQSGGHWYLKANSGASFISADGEITCIDHINGSVIVLVPIC